MYYIDIANYSVNKYGEELCGDHVEKIKTSEGMIVVLSDGLGSGVKANILATLTSKIAITMLKGGASIEDTILTITNTLPECQVRKLAYSTFTIIEIRNSGEVYMVEYDNPPVFFYRKSKPFPIYKEEKIINGKRIYESNFTMAEGDTLAIVSDGAVHAGVGKTLNLGWQWNHIDEYLQDLIRTQHSADSVSSNLLSVCENLYDSKPGDDTTVVAIKLQSVKYLDLFAGPPKNKNDDRIMMEKLKAARGKVVLCGGTTANIVSRELNEPIEIELKHYTSKVPPIGYMRNIDLVTEGLLTLNAAKELLERYTIKKLKGELPEPLHGQDGASRLAKLLIDECTTIHIWLGQAVNPAHQNPNFPEDFNLKNKIVTEIAHQLKVIGKDVQITYL